MLFKISIFISAIALMECSPVSHFIRGSNWEKGLNSCWSGGAYETTSTYNIGTLNSVGLKYGDMNVSTVIYARGRLEITTKGTGTVKDSKMILKNYYETSAYRKFENSWVESAWLGWAYQEGRIRINIKIYDNGSIELTIYVYAGSWGAISCAETKAFVDTIEIITEIVEKKPSSTSTTTTTTTTSMLRPNITLNMNLKPTSPNEEEHTANSHDSKLTISFLLYVTSAVILCAFIYLLVSLFIRLRRQERLDKIIAPDEIHKCAL